MKSILLAAGYGTRLRPLTETIPKCLVPINGKPLLEIWLENLNSAGVKEFLINTHYLPEQVVNFIEDSPYRDKVKLSYEPKILGTAGTLLNNIDFFGPNDGILIHADNYCLADFKGFIEAHKNRPSNCLMTMMTFRSDNPSSCGILKIDGEGIVREFHEKVENPPGNLANGAIYILSKELIQKIKEEYPLAEDFSVDILGEFLGKIFTYEITEPFIDVGTPENYKKANSIPIK